MASHQYPCAHKKYIQMLKKKCSKFAILKRIGNHYGLFSASQRATN